MEDFKEAMEYNGITIPQLAIAAVIVVGGGIYCIYAINLYPLF